MKEYVLTAILLLTLCSVSPFKLYLPGEATRDGPEDEIHDIVDQVTAVCVEVCLGGHGRKPSDLAACRAVCAAPLTAAAVAAAAASLDVGDAVPASAPARAPRAPRPTPGSAPPPALLLHPPGGPNAGKQGAGPPEHGLKGAAAKRQVDPVLACIEARCAGLGRYYYGSCIFSKCLGGWKRKRGEQSAGGDGGDGGGGGDAPEAEALFQNEAVTSSSSAEGKDRMERYDVIKRSWNDVMQTCIEYKCSDTSPGSFKYNVCIQHACSKHMFGRR